MVICKFSKMLRELKCFDFEAHLGVILRLLKRLLFFCNLEIDFLANLSEYMNNQFGNSTRLCRRVGNDSFESSMEKLS